MRTSIRWDWDISTFAVLSILTLVNAGCATNGRQVLLKEYGPTVPVLANEPLKGKTICLKGFECAADLSAPDPATKPEQPPQFKFVDFTSEQNKTWDQEFNDLKKNTKESDWRQIGNVRNGFGMVLSHVYAMNDPAAWLTETLKMDLERQGATVVDASQARTADLCVGGQIQFCRVDAYMKVWGDLVVNLELQPKQGDTHHKLFHTDGGTVQWIGSTGEFYKPLRECRQKFSWLAISEIEQALKQ